MHHDCDDSLTAEKGPRGGLVVREKRPRVIHRRVVGRVLPERVAIPHHVPTAMMSA